jgi:hypothetical protein
MRWVVKLVRSVRVPGRIDVMVTMSAIGQTHVKFWILSGWRSAAGVQLGAYGWAS